MRRYALHFVQSGEFVEFKGGFGNLKLYNSTLIYFEVSMENLECSVFYTDLNTLFRTLLLIYLNNSYSNIVNSIEI